jgi:hypothetical protein
MDSLYPYFDTDICAPQPPAWYRKGHHVPTNARGVFFLTRNGKLGRMQEAPRAPCPPPIPRP